MPLEILVGTQWGDEGKGRIVDLMAAKADLVARFNGGDNAGHTVTVGDQNFKLHLIPSGVIHPHTLAVLGNGLVINPLSLLKEMDMLRAAGVEINPDRLFVSYAAHLITPAHIALDKAQEMARGKGQIGTTGRGIGPAYTDKAARQGLRMVDILDITSFRLKLAEHIREANKKLVKLFCVDPLNVDAVVDEFSGYAVQLAPYIQDTGILITNALKQGKRVLAEGAQGALLDLEHGTYPFVTSSTVLATGVFAGLGLGILPVERVVGATKAFQSRVGSGPFPTEVLGEEASRLRGTGANPWDEFGTTTGRPRRVGWLDTVLLRYTARINGLTEQVLTKLDVLSGLPVIKVCTEYILDGVHYSELPFGPSNLSPFEPQFEELPGWVEDISSARTWNDLPAAAQTYIRRVEALSGVRVCMVSVGPEREQIVEIPA